MKEWPHVGGEAFHSSLPQLLFVFSICGLPNYNEAHYLGFRQDVFVPAIQKAKEKERNEAFGAHDQTGNYREHIGFTGFSGGRDKQKMG